MGGGGGAEKEGRDRAVVVGDTVGEREGGGGGELELENFNIQG